MVEDSFDRELVLESVVGVYEEWTRRLSGTPLFPVPPRFPSYGTG